MQHTPSECLGELDHVLIELRLLMGQQAIPKVEEAKVWLRSMGGSMTARALGRLSSARNAQAHSLAKRVVADAHRLAEKVSTSSVDESLAPSMQEMAACVPAVSAPPSAPTVKPPGSLLGSDGDDVLDEVLEDVAPDIRAADPLLGVKIGRNFDGVCCRGVVRDVQREQVSRELLYLVKYDDGGSQHLTAAEVKSCTRRSRGT